MDTAQPTDGGSTGGLGRLAWRVVYRQQPLRMGKPTGLVVAHCCRGVEPVVGIPTHLTAHVQNEPAPPGIDPPRVETSGSHSYQTRCVRLDWPS